MIEVEEEIMLRLRGGKVAYHLVDGETILIDAGLYPFDKSKIPIQCKLPEEKLEEKFGYTSGNRSVVFRFDDGWFKAKAIGIPSGVSQPIYRRRIVHTYYLYNAFIGSGRVVWGFMTIGEAEREIYWMNKAWELDLPATRPIGIGVYPKVKILEFPNRYALFNFLRAKSRDEVLNLFECDGKNAGAACLFSLEPGDVRADEILYGLLFPRIDELMDLEECKAYLRWLGSSCAYNLRLHHHSGILHGTIRREDGLMTNSHLANHIVGFEKTWVTDYHMASEIRSRAEEKLKLEEYYCLWHVMNPLPAASLLVRARRRRISLLDLPQIQFEVAPYKSFYVWENIMKIHAGLYSPASIYEELTASLIDGMEYGYNRGKVLEVERKLKRKMLINLSILKEELWNLYGLPKGMQRGVEVLRNLMRVKKLDEDYLNRKILELKEILRV